MNVRSAAIALGTFFVLAQAAVAAELRAPSTRAQLEDYLETIAISEMEKLVDRPPVRIYYSTAGGGGGTAAPSHSTTNVQVQGVDEPDFVKNDGGYIFKTVGEAVSIIDAVPASQMSEIARYKTEGYANALFLSGKTLVVFSSPTTPPPGMERPNSGRPGGWWGGPRAMMGIWGGPTGGYNPIVKVTLLDLTRPSQPVVKRELYIEGSFVDARLVGNEMHVITSAQPSGPELRWYDWSTGTQPTTANLDAIKAENRRRIRAATLDDYLPRQLDKANARRPEPLLAVGHVYRPAVAEGRNVLSVSTLDISTRYGRLKSTAMIGESGEIYASKDALYVACYRWRYWTESGIGQEPGDVSEIHKFHVGDGSAPIYIGTGEVEGRVLNQFAMDEWNGSLRVATTTEATGAAGRPQLNHVFVLRPLAWWSTRLYKIGEIRDIAPNERIYSTRFLGERAFIVTFRQVDPLFAVDMRRLQVKGELKVDGFSTYLHPVGTTHLLAVGNAVDPATNRITGIDLSLFDVRDLAAPKLAHRATIPGAWSSSLYEHKAFTFFESNGTLAIPLNDWQNGFSGLEVYNVSLTTGFRSRGKVNHADLAQRLGWTWAPEVSRSIIIGSAIYSVSEVGVKANRTLDPRTEYSSVLLQQTTP
jgi:uncharacterized secreted protein with C-terminal beta-propeller domain